MLKLNLKRNIDASTKGMRMLQSEGVKFYGNLDGCVVDMSITIVQYRGAKGVGACDIIVKVADRAYFNTLRSDNGVLTAMNELFDTLFSGVYDRGGVQLSSYKLLLSIVDKLSATDTGGFLMTNSLPSRLDTSRLGSKFIII